MSYVSKAEWAEREKKVRELLKTMTCAEAARELQISEDTLRDWRRRFGMLKYTGQKKAKIPREELERMLQTMTRYQIARANHMAFDTVNDMIREYGLTVPRLRKNQKGTKIDSICFDCKNGACGCTWSMWFQPVKGWEAIPHLRDTGEMTYTVLKCPQFIPDRRSEEE